MKVMAITVLIAIPLNSYEYKGEVEFGGGLPRTNGDSFDRTFVIRFITRVGKTMMHSSNGRGHQC